MLLGIERYQNTHTGFAGLAIHLAGVAFLLAALTGCSDSRFSDLEGYVQRIKAKPAERILPLPEFKLYETFAYSADELRDPFFMLDDEAEIAVGETVVYTGPKPDKDRNKETLEQYPLDSLKFVGHLEKDNDQWAIVTSPDKLVHRVKSGNFIGQNYGRIMAISEGRMEISELVPDGMGGWIEREAALSLGN